jgi:uncharacterized protein YqhQ
MDIFALYTLTTSGNGETFQDSNNNDNNNNNEKLNKVVRKIKVAGTLLIIYFVLAIIFHIMMTVITAYLAPSLKPLHAILYFFFGIFWLCPMLIYYVLANGFTLVPPRPTMNNMQRASFNNRRF